MNRRYFNKLLAGGSVAVPLATLTVGRNAIADEQPMVDPEAVTAKALQYMVVSDREQKCESCILYQAEDGAKAGLCSIFPGQYVPAEAWCSAYQPKPA